MTREELNTLADSRGMIRVQSNGLLWHQLRDAVRAGLLVQVSYFQFSLPDGG